MADDGDMSSPHPIAGFMLPDGFTHIHKVLIANRGEIACRIIKTCKSLGLSSVSIYSPADRSSLHVRQAGEAYLLPGPDQTAYIDEEAILDIVTKSGAQAVIPGYGELLLAACSRVTSPQREDRRVTSTYTLGFVPAKSWQASYPRTLDLPNESNEPDSSGSGLRRR
jgi:hypothetical protein